MLPIELTKQIRGHLKFHLPPRCIFVAGPGCCWVMKNPAHSVHSMSRSWRNFIGGYQMSWTRRVVPCERCALPCKPKIGYGSFCQPCLQDKLNFAGEQDRRHLLLTIEQLAFGHHCDSAEVERLRSLLTAHRLHLAWYQTINLT